MYRPSYDGTNKKVLWQELWRHEFEAALEELIQRRGLRSKSEAIRLAVREAAERCRRGERAALHRLRGIVRRERPRVADDALWEAGSLGD